MDERLIQLLQQAGSPDGFDITALLGELDDGNPRHRLLAHYLQQQAASAEDEPEQDEPDPLAVAAAETQQRRQRAYKRLRHLVQQMYAELEMLRERNDALADAVGACYLCWGSDPECEVCQGDGRPGAAPPDPTLFDRLVTPALHHRYGPPRRPVSVRSNL